MQKRYLAGLVSTHGKLRSRQLCQTPLNRGEAYHVRTWLSSWSCAIHEACTMMQQHAAPVLCPSIIMAEEDEEELLNLFQPAQG